MKINKIRVQFQNLQICTMLRCTSSNLVIEMYIY